MSFTCFPNLPTELRLKIWYASLPGPRTITIFCPNHKSPLRGTCNAPTHKTLASFLLTCKTTHSIVQENYPLYFHTRLWYPIPFDPSLDTLYFLNAAEIHFFLNHYYCPPWQSTANLETAQDWEIHQVQRIIVPYPYVCKHAIQTSMSRSTTCAIILRSLLDFGNLTELGVMASMEMKGEKLKEFFGEVERSFWERSFPVSWGGIDLKGALDRVQFKVLEGELGNL